MVISSWLLSELLLYKYVALFVIDYLGAIIVPWPVNALLLAIGAFSSQGYFNFWAALAVAVVGNCLGDLTDYGLTRRYGETVIKFLHLDRSRFFRQLKEELRTDAAITVFTTRFAGSLSSIANFTAGLVGVPFATFAFFDFLGNVIEPGAALAIGYAVGEYWNDFSGILEVFASIVAVAVILFIIVRIYQRMLKHERERGGTDGI